MCVLGSKEGKRWGTNIHVENDNTSRRREKEREDEGNLGVAIQRERK